MRTLFLSMLVTCLSAAAFAGSSDRFSMASGYNAGRLDVSIFGAPQGAVDRVLTAFLAAGAVKTDHPAFSIVAFPGDSSQAIIINPAHTGLNAPGGGPSSGPSSSETNGPQGLNLQWNFHLTLENDVNVNTMGPGIGFKGPVAESLYDGLSKSGAKVGGQTADDKGEFTVPTYADRSDKYSIYCQKQKNVASCYIGIR